MIGSLGNLIFKLHISPRTYVKFPRATYHMIVPSTEELYRLNVTLHAKRGLIQISRYGYFHGLDRETKKNHWNVSEISPTHREHGMKKVTATMKYFTP